MSTFRDNNFNIIRLFAASTILLVHLNEFFSFQLYKSLSFVLLPFPGVPIFFFISGYLISKSYEVTQDLRFFFLKRFLRLYPALWLSLGISIVLLLVSGFHPRNVEVDKALFWLGGQMTFIHFYHPDFLREYGVGVLNGNLWTIGVELQFYILTPLIYRLFNLNGKSNVKLFFLIAFFLPFNLLFYNKLYSQYWDLLVVKLLFVSFLPHIYIYILGIVFQKNFKTIYSYVKGKALVCVVFHVLLSYLLINIGFRTGNGITPILIPSLLVSIMAIAYSSKGFSDRILGSSDISYGIYIYHMPIINYVLFVNCEVPVVITVVCTVLLATFSWNFVESPALELKTKWC